MASRGSLKAAAWVDVTRMGDITEARKVIAIAVAHDVVTPKGSSMGPSIKYVMLFLTSFDTLSPPLSHFVTHLGTPPIKYVTSQNTPPKITRLQYALLNFVRSALISIESQLYCIVL